MTPVPYDAEKARVRLKRLFSYLQELNRARTPLSVHLDAYAWTLSLTALPPYDSVQRGPRLNPNIAGKMDENIILQVGRPMETPCPEPAKLILDWLKPGWEEVGVEPQVHLKRRLPDGVERFDDSEDRLDAYDDWLDGRMEWEEKEKHVVDGLEVFSDLFELWGRFERESEKYQLFLGDGILVADSPDGPVRHPLLVQAVHLDFDPRVPLFTIRESDVDPEIYTPILRHLGAPIQGLADLKDRDRTLIQVVSKEFCHPLDDEKTTKFLKNLVNRYWEEGQYFDQDPQLSEAPAPYIYREPMLFLGNRNLGFSDAAARYIKTLDDGHSPPDSLLRIVGIEPPPRRGEEDKSADLLLTKHANPEQERVIHRLEETGAVLVQGPPGTGKSHTIANIIGHLLAQKKSILVTSHASKALHVVREKVAEPLQALCVSLLDSDGESARQLEESISGIVNYFGKTSAKKLAKEIDMLAQKRAELKHKHDDLRSQFLAALKSEYTEVEVAGLLLTPGSIAQKLRKMDPEDDWIPVPVAAGADLPLSTPELRELYQLNAKINPADAAKLTRELPDLEHLPTSSQVQELFETIARLQQKSRDLGQGFWRHREQTDEALETMSEEVGDAARVFEDTSDWVLECVEAGRKGGDEKATWDALLQLIETCCEAIPAREKIIMERGPKVRSDKPTEELITACEELIVHIRSGKGLGRMTTLLKSEWRGLIKASKVDDNNPTRLAHFEAVLAYLEVRSMRETLKRRWERQLTPLGAPDISELGRKPEKGANPYAEMMASALNWYNKRWPQCQQALEDAGFDWHRRLEEIPVPASAYGEVERVRLLLGELPTFIRARRDDLAYAATCEQQEQWLQDIAAFDGKGGPAHDLHKAISKTDHTRYEQAWGELERLVDVQADQRRRQELLDRLSTAAAGWATAIEERRPPHDGESIPGDVKKAWRYRQWTEQLSHMHKFDIDELQTDLNRVTEQLHDVTAQYVEKLAWAAQFERTGLKQQQALTGWLGLHQKMGKGKVKNIGRLRAEAKKLLVDCRQAVPVWIMPLSRVVESFDIAETQFDVVIIDEASQSDVLGLTAFALGKSVAVVGDHEQVSPYAIGHQTDRIQALIDELLTDIPNKQLYDGKTSVYDLARQSFGETIRLLEHFRCVPSIIEFSNELCYNGEIRALREASDGKVEPHVIEHHVPGGVAVNRINEKEALVVASLVSACCKLKEYEGCTIGVISMVGTEQALYIDSILRRRIKVSDCQKRRLLCGNASQFQGDERDIIFLTVVDSPSDKPLTMRQRAETRKAFNVASSRARDQMWVVHSLSPNRDLKPDDLRLRLISHAKKRGKISQKAPEKVKKLSSDFYEEVCRSLIDAGYRVIRQCRVGDYVLELVVEGEGGRRIGIFCEGGRVQTEQELQDALEYQLTLERLGWNFIRLRASEYNLHPEKAMKKLRTRLKKTGIKAIGPIEAQSPDAEPEEPLKAKVLRRAEIIRSRWRNIPPPGADLKSKEATDSPKGTGADRKQRRT